MCDMLYVACEEQKKKYEKLFGKKCKVLRKPAECYDRGFVGLQNAGRTFLYVGNLGTGRSKTVAEVGRCISDAGGVLRVYSATPVTKSLIGKFEKNKIDFRGYAPSDVIEEECRNADVLLFAEGFGKKDIALTKYSVSTKFPWYLGSGKMILAAGPEGIHTIDYLKRENAAVTATDKSFFAVKAKSCFENDEKLIRNAKLCVARDFDKSTIQEMLKEDILRMASERGECL